MLAFALAIPFTLGLQMECNVRTNCYESGWFPVFSLMGPTNSHIGEWNAPGAQYFSCCKGTDLINPTHEGATVIYVGGTINSHAWSNPGVGLTPILFNTTSPIECNVKQTSCDAGWVVLASMIGPDNSHVGNVSDYSYKICCHKTCMGELDTCGGLSDHCCLTNNALPTPSPLYCSDGKDNELPAIDYHCCPAGSYWDKQLGSCKETTECGISNELGRCSGDIILNTQTWFSDADCKTPQTPAYTQGCCLVDRYGITGYYFNDTYVYPNPNSAPIK